MDLKIKRIVVGPIQTNCYLIISDNELATIDPGDEAEKIIAEIEPSLRHSRHSTLRYIPHHSDSKSGGGNPDTKIIPKYILLTHGHFDHVMAVNELRKKFGFKVVISERDKDISLINHEIGVNIPDMKADITVKEGDNIHFSDKEIKVFETPGHSRGSVCYKIAGNLFTGDTLFHQSYGRTDLPGGSEGEMRKSLEKLLKLNKNIRVYPGHGKETTIGEEQEFFKNYRF